MDNGYEESMMIHTQHILLMDIDRVNEQNKQGAWDSLTEKAYKRNQHREQDDLQDRQVPLSKERDQKRNHH